MFGAPGVQGPRHSGPPVGSGPTEPPAQVTKPRTPKASSTLGCHYLASEKPTLHWGWGERGPQRHRALSEGTAQTSAPRAPPKSWWPAEPPTQSQFKDPPEAESPPTLAGAACSTLCPPRTAPRHCQPPRKSLGSSESRGGGAGGEAAGALSSCFHACCPPQGIRTPPHCLARPGPVVWCPGPFSMCISLGTGANDARGEGRGSRGGAGLMARRCGQPPRAGPSAWGQRPLRSLLWAVRSQPPGPDQPCPCLPESVATGLSIPEHSLGTGSDLGALGRPFSAAPSRTFRVLSSKCRGADSGLGAMSSVGPQPVQQGREGPSTRLWGASSDPPSPRCPRHAQELGDTLPPLSH